MTTKYPGAIDGYQDIRVVTDRQSEIVAQDHNDLRSAILAIENALGIDPQGVYGTVVSRLEGSDATFTDHVRGVSDRHYDTAIDGYEKTGTYFNLSAGTVAAQLDEVLAKLNSNYIYDGSSSSFPDGYQLPSSSVDAAISQIVSQLHDVPMDKALDAFVVEGCAVSAGTGVNASVAAGWISSNGVVRKASAQAVTVPTGAGTYYLYAYNSNNAVVFGCAVAASVPYDPDNPIVLLHKIVHNGSSWTSASCKDIRRYGAFVNNKSHFTVGDTPTSGNDGYGCDFLSLEAAFEHIKALEAAASDEMLISKKVVLVSDITVPSYSSSYELDGYGWEIDGGGCKLTIDSDVPYLEITGNNIRIHNVTVESALAATNAGATLVKLSNCENIIITNCHLTKITALSFAGLVDVDVNVSNCIITNNIVEAKYGLIMNGYMTDSIVANNRVFQKTLANVTNSLYSGISIGSNCIVEGNYIYGNYYSGIKVAIVDDNTIIRNNVIIYPYRYGINGGNSIIDNYIIGDVSLTLNAAINFGNSGIIKGNYISGCKGLGIDCNSKSYSIISNNRLIGDNLNTTTAIDAIGSFSIVTNNLIYKYGASDSDCALYCSTKNLIVNNSIYYQYGISIDVNGGPDSIIEGNIIAGLGSISGQAIKDLGTGCVVSGNFITSCSGNTNGTIGLSFPSHCTIFNNRMYYCSGTAIDGNDRNQSSIIGNVIDGYSGSKTAIDNVGSYSLVSGNRIKDYGSVADGYCIYVSEDKVTISNNYIYGIITGDLLAAVIQIEESSGGNNLISNNNITLTQKTQINLKETPGNLIIGNKLSTNGSLGDLGDHAIAKAGLSNLIIGNSISNPHGDGIECSADNVVCSNNIIADAQGVGITVETGNTGCYICDSVIAVPTNGAIVVESISHNTFIKNNIITETESLTASIDCGSNSVIVSGNVMQGTNTDYGISNFGTYSQITNNVTIQYTEVAIRTTAAAEHSLISGNIIMYPGVGTLSAGIEISATSEGSMIVNNVLGGNGTSEKMTFYGIDLNRAANICCLGNIIYGSDSNSNAQSIFDVGSYSIIANNRIDGTNGDGIYCFGDSLIVSNNYIDMDDTVGTQTGIYVTGDNNIINGNKVFKSSGNGISVSSGSSSCFVCNNIIEYADGYSIFMQNRGHIVNNNYINQSDNVSIYVTASQSSISNNYIVNSGTDAICVLSYKNSINGNYIEECGQYGINLAHANTFYTMIAGNNIYGCEGGTIYALAGANNLLIVGNYIFEGDAIAGSSITCNGSTDTLIVGNYMKGDATVSAISGVGSRGIIVDNIINKYLAGPTISTNTADSFIISNNSIVGVSNTLTKAILLTSSSKGSIINNLIGDESAKLYYIGIDLNGSNNVNCSGNFVFSQDTANTSSAIYNVGGNSIVSGNYLLGTNGHGIYISSGSEEQSIINNNYIDMLKTNGTYHGIYIGASKNTIVGNCICNCSGNGISIVDFIQNNIISSNFIYDCANNGIHYTGNSGKDAIYNNYIYGADNDGIVVDGYSLCSQNFINSVGRHGINIIDDCISVIGNYIEDPTNNGIYCNVGLSSGNISFNVITDSIYGIDLSSSSEKINLNVVGNNIINCGTYGMILSHCQRSNISNNSVMNASSYGITVINSLWTNVSGNNITRCATGLTVTSDGYSIFNGNTISHSSSYGMDVQSTSESIISNNLIGPGNGTSDTMIIGDVTNDNLIVMGNFVCSNAGNTAVSYSGTYNVKLMGNLAKGGSNPNASHWNVGFIHDSNNNIYVVAG